MSWYTKGGFTDENGKRHESGHHFKIRLLGGLQRDRFRAQHDSASTTRNATMLWSTAIRKVSPETKFVGLALADPSSNPQMFEYFLNPRNHKPRHRRWT